ncbi:MAG: lipid-A-disaccharide synthase, partial [Pseudomonadota bacterium]
MKAFVIAGEPSGDALGAALIDGLRATGPLTVTGIGGPMMASAGMPSLFPMDDLSVMGVVEVLPRLPRLLWRLRQTVRAAQAAAPDVLITVDSPDFTLRVARRLRAKQGAAAPPVVHYVAPSVWAWRPERAGRMAAHVDHVLALLPFEPPYMEAAGMSCDFVGHPAAAALPPSPGDMAALRDDLGFGPAPVLTLLPGSRRGEVARLAPVYAQVARQVLAARPDMRFV